MPQLVFIFKRGRSTLPLNFYFDKFVKPVVFYGSAALFILQGSVHDTKST